MRRINVRAMRSRIITSLLALSAMLLAALGWVKYDPLPESNRRPFKRVGESVSLENLKWHVNEGRIGSWQSAAKRIVALKPGVVRLSVQMRDVQRGMGGPLEWGETKELASIFVAKGIPVILVLGAKNLQWPEQYLHPELEAIAKDKGGIIDFDVWMPTVDKNGGPGLQWFLMECYNTWANEPGIEAIQVENEPFEATGPKPGYVIADELLNLEVDMARQSTKKPIVLTMGMGMTDWPHKMWLRRKSYQDSLLAHKPDILGYNLYEMGFVDTFPWFFLATATHWQNAARLIAEAKAESARTGIPLKIVLSELQAEPWERGRKVNYKDPNGNWSMTPSRCRDLFLRAEKLGADEAWLWGVENAVACSEQGNPAWLDMHKELIARAQPQQ